MLVGAVDAGVLPELQAHLGAQTPVYGLALGDLWRRTGVRIAKAIVVSSWGSPAGGEVK
jgi:hypothetical protein